MLSGDEMVSPQGMKWYPYLYTSYIRPIVRTVDMWKTTSKGIQQDAATRLADRKDKGAGIAQKNRNTVRRLLEGCRGSHLHCAGN